MPEKVDNDFRISLIEFLIITQIATIPFICNFDKEDKQFHILWRSSDKCGSLQLTTNCLVFGQEYLATTHSGRSGIGASES